MKESEIVTTYNCSKKGMPLNVEITEASSCWKLYWKSMNVW